MNKNMAIALTVIVLLLLGGGAIMLLNRPPAAITPQSAQSGNMAGSQTNSGNAMMQKTSLKTLMTSSGNQKCTYEDSKTGSSGVTYISNGKMRGDFTYQAQGSTSATHMISDSQNAYIWMDNTPSGYKVSLSSMEEIKNKAATNPQVQQSFDMNQQFEYNCSSWSADESMFSIPTDKKFEDMSAMMENAGKMMEGQKGTPAMPDAKEACAACDQAPPEAQAQCKAALKCN